MLEYGTIVCAVLIFFAIGFGLIMLIWKAFNEPIKRKGLKHTNYVMIEWTPEELFYKMFCKKMCPKCFVCMNHKWDAEYSGRKRGFGTGTIQTNQLYDVYICESCNREYSISELVKCEKTINWKVIWIMVFCVLVGIAFFPYAKAEYLTLKYGEAFEKGYEQTNMTPQASYYKVIAHSETEAEVFYVDKETIGYKIWFHFEDDEWKMTKWDCIWSTSGNADSFCWPYYH